MESPGEPRGLISSLKGGKGGSPPESIQCSERSPRFPVAPSGSTSARGLHRAQVHPVRARPRGPSPVVDACTEAPPPQTHASSEGLAAPLWTSKRARKARSFSRRRPRWVSAPEPRAITVLASPSRVRPSPSRRRASSGRCPLARLRTGPPVWHPLHAGPSIKAKGVAAHRRSRRRRLQRRQPTATAGVRESQAAAVPRGTAETESLVALVPRACGGLEGMQEAAARALLLASTAPLRL